MVPDPAVSGIDEVDGEVMAAIDDGRFLIADLGRDDAWLSTPRTAALDLDDNR